MAAYCGHAAWPLFASHADQELSFTDCTSFALMRELDLRETSNDGLVWVISPGEYLYTLFRTVLST